MKLPKTNSQLITFILLFGLITSLMGCGPGTTDGDTTPDVGDDTEQVSPDSELEQEESGEEMEGMEEEEDDDDES